MRKKRKTPKRRNAVVQAHIARRGAGAGAHHNRARRAIQVPRKAKHKASNRGLGRYLRGTRRAQATLAR